MQPTPERFGPARGSALFAAILWAIVITAAVFMALGDETAINAVIGCSIPAVFVTAWAVVFRRQDRQHAEEMRALYARLEGERRR
ncbi:hypothetical protein ACN6K5_003611 [Streptomyces violaceoruber]|uniref:hypothetical protein n=1 Tax=Streptomyces violaceoruber TaxID=1935 RepID=UPI00403CDCF1